MYFRFTFFSKKKLYYYESDEQNKTALTLLWRRAPRRILPSNNQPYITPHKYTYSKQRGISMYHVGEAAPSRQQVTKR